MNTRKLIQNAMWLLAIFLLLNMVLGGEKEEQEASGWVPYSSFLSQIENSKVDKASVEEKSDETIIRFMREGDKTVYKTRAPRHDPGLVGDLKREGVLFGVQKPDKPSVLFQILMSWGPMLLLIGVWVWFMNKQSGAAGGGVGGHPMGKSRAKPIPPGENKYTFADVAGVDEAKEEVGELVEFLRSPGKFRSLGGKIPRGILMTGQPGTGKTLLAKAIAGEAKVPFFTISGSDFVEMFVGVGASRVRDMFAEAKKEAPCIIFIDEIDAVGRHRGSGLGGGHDEREQTLNQLLVEMDGFADNDGVIIIAATNRPDVLDPALLRPGRFDRQVVVPLPDRGGREKILKVHSRGKPLGDDVNLNVVARSLPGTTGADLENIINEAALFAARADKKEIHMEDFEKAKDKVIMGAERRSVVMPEEELKNTAYHEVGHVVVAKVLPNTDPVHKVTIIPRGGALGATMQLPEDDRYSHNKEHLLSTISVLMGGRIAEELFMKQMTTGASNDFERATDLARKMVTRWGMSEKLGPVVYAENQGSVFLGRDLQNHKHLSDATSEEVDNEIRDIIQDRYNKARKILEDKRDTVEAMAKSLLEWETLDEKQITTIMEGGEIESPAA
jgi:cell division protease FtsH